MTKDQGWLVALRCLRGAPEPPSLRIAPRAKNGKRRETAGKLTINVSLFLCVCLKKKMVKIVSQTSPFLKQRYFWHVH